MKLGFIRGCIDKVRCWINIIMFFWLFSRPNESCKGFSFSNCVLFFLISEHYFIAQELIWIFNICLDMLFTLQHVMSSGNDDVERF